MKIIFLGGKANSGKDSSAEFIDEYYKDCSADIHNYLSYLDTLYEAMADRGYRGDIHTGVQLRKEFFKIDEIRILQQLLNKALTKAKDMTDRSVSSKIYDRIYPLTFFYKWVLLCCFGNDISTNEYHQIICDLRYHTYKYEVYSFRSEYATKIEAHTCNQFWMFSSRTDKQPGKNSSVKLKQTKEGKNHEKTFGDFMSCFYASGVCVLR